MTYTHLKLYERPQYYIGDTWYGWYPVYSRTRDSGVLDRANYQVILMGLRELDSELVESEVDSRNEDSAGDSTVTDTRCSHFLCGWVETVYVHSSNVRACELADKMLSDLQDYPVLDEDLLCELESEACNDIWSSLDASDRIEYLRHHPYTADSLGELLRAVRGNWSDASIVLDNPSEVCE